MKTHPCLLKCSHQAAGPGVYAQPLLTPCAAGANTSSCHRRVHAGREWRQCMSSRPMLGSQCRLIGKQNSYVTICLGSTIITALHTLKTKESTIHQWSRDSTPAKVRPHFEQRKCKGGGKRHTNRRPGFANNAFLKPRFLRGSCDAHNAIQQIATHIPLFALRAVDRGRVGRVAQHSSFAGRLIQVINRASGSARTL